MYDEVRLSNEGYTECVVDSARGMTPVLIVFADKKNKRMSRISVIKWPESGSSLERRNFIAVLVLD